MNPEPHALPGRLQSPAQDSLPTRGSGSVGGGGAGVGREADLHLQSTGGQRGFLKVLCPQPSSSPDPGEPSSRVIASTGDSIQPPAPPHRPEAPRHPCPWRGLDQEHLPLAGSQVPACQAEWCPLSLRGSSSPAREAFVIAGLHIKKSGAEF